ncbi:hypothetical protein Ddc_18031 [Ditylenchus destructor]|nr:hypothetical protein Ddc_18031 [Ditylenchus destructor]
MKFLSLIVLLATLTIFVSGLAAEIRFARGASSASELAQAQAEGGNVIEATSKNKQNWTATLALPSPVSG